MHTRPKDPQASLTTQSVIASKNDGRIFANEPLDDKYDKQSPQTIYVPNGMREESVVVGEVTISNRITGYDQIRDVPMPSRQHPTGHAQPKGLKAGFSKNRPKRE